MGKVRFIMIKRFKDKVVVITGGTDGIGLTTAKAFAAEGALVYITGRRKERLDEALKEIGTGAVGIQGDVSDPVAVDRLYARIQQDHGRVDVVFANAGVSESRQSAKSRKTISTAYSISMLRGQSSRCKRLYRSSPPVGPSC